MANIPKPASKGNRLSNLIDAARTPNALTQQATELNTGMALVDGRYDDPDGFFVSMAPPDGGVRWSKLYPYQLLMLEANNSGGYSIRDKFTLPISPSDLSVRSPFAIQTTVTLKGIVEEHNASPLRQISFSGTTGVWPRRRSVGRAASASMLDTIIGGTINAVDRTANQFEKIFTGERLDAARNVSSPQSESDGSGIETTGYYQFHLMFAFLERYALAKKGGSRKDTKLGGLDPSRLRLAFAMWKDNWVWLVTPKQFNLDRSAADPMAYRYSFNAVAWKRVDLAAAASDAIGYKPAPRSINKLQASLNSLRQARRTVQGAQGIVRAVRSDVGTTVFGNMRESILFLKDIIGVPLTLMDLPASILQDFKTTVVGSWNELSLTLPQSTTARVDSTKSLTVASRLDEVRSETTGRGTASPSVEATADPINKIFEDPNSEPDFFDAVEIDAMDVPLDLTRRVEAEVERVRALDRQDFVGFKNDFLAVSTDLADHFGLSSATFNRINGLEVPTSGVVGNVTPEEMEALFALQQSIQEMDRLTATYTLKEDQIPSSFQFVKGLADDAGVQYDVPNSKFAVPLPYGLTMEQISLQYLGDPNRWMEIVTLNGLRAPYIDETGFELTLLANGQGNKILVDSADNLYIGQYVKLFSTTVPTFRRKILNIEEIDDNNVFITLDGIADLDKLKTSDTAKAKMYLPATVNSEQLIFIPSKGQPPEDFKTLSISREVDADRLRRMSKVDLLIDSAGDLVVTSTGEARLAYGLTNLVQAARLKVSTPRGSLLQHPSYGFSIDAGTSTADISAEQALQSLQSSFAGDSRFTGVESLQVIKKGNTLAMTMLVGAAGEENLLPVTIEMSTPGKQS